MCSIHCALASLVVKSLSAMQETQVQPLSWEDLLENEMTIHSSILAREIPWTEEPGRLQLMGSRRVRHDWATNSFSFQFLPNIAKLRLICLQNKPGLNKVGLMIYINYNWWYRPILLCWNFYRVSDWTFTRLLRARKVMPRACHRYHLTGQGEFLPFQGRQHTLRFLYLLVS